MTTRLVFGCKSEGNRLSTTVRGRGLTQIDIYIIISHHHSRVLARLVWLGVSQTEHAIFTYDSTNQHEIQHLHETFRANVFPVKVINSIHNTLSHNHSKLLGDMTTTMVSQTLSMSMATTYTKVVATEQYHWKRRVQEAPRIEDKIVNNFYGQNLFQFCQN